MILLTLANTDPQVIFWPLMMVPALREVPVAPDCLAVPHLPAPYHFGGLRCLAVPRFGIFHGRYGSLLHL